MSDIISREGAILAILETESKVARETPYDNDDMDFTKVW